MSDARTPESAGAVKYRHYPKRRFGKITIEKVVGGGPEGAQSVPYLDRWYVLRIPWLCSIRLHHILQPDLDPDPHDHPWTFFSIVLRGWYAERWAKAGTYHYCDGREGLGRVVRRFNHHRYTDVHRIVQFSHGGVWTLVFTGPEHRAWGFETPIARIPYHIYLDLDEPPHQRDRVALWDRAIEALDRWTA